MQASTTFHRRAAIRSAVLVATAAAASGQVLTAFAQEGTPIAIAGSPAGDQLLWVLDTANNGAAPAVSELEAHFNSEFLQAVPIADMQGFFGQLSASAPIAIVDYFEAPGGTQAQAFVTSSTGEEFQVVIAVEPVEPYRIASLVFSPAEAQATPIALASWEEFDALWTGLAEDAVFLAAEVVDGECVPIHSLAADTRLGIGSTFKLWILGALARAVEAGDLAWDQPIAIRDEWKSLPSGDMRLIQAGETRTIREFAEQMISMSDNTATDHLLFTVGRANVEAMLGQMGHADPSVNTPMLSTRGLFALKLFYPDDKVEAYLAAPDDEQRRLLETEIETIPLTLENIAEWSTPRRIDTVEWFASPDELCSAMATLDGLSGEAGLEPVAEILAINPGVPLDPAVWSYVGFKGGSEVGVINGTWLLRRADGRTFVVTGTHNDPTRAVDEGAGINALVSAFDLVAQTP